MTSTLEYFVLNALVYECQIIHVEGNRDRLLSQLLPLYPTAHYIPHYRYGYQC